MAEMIKVWLGNETLWVLPVGNNLAKLKNVPSDTPGYGFDDLVRLEGNVIVERVERCTRTVVVGYDEGEDEPTARQRFRAIRIYLEPHGILCERYGDGLIGMSVPMHLKKSKFRWLSVNSPYPFVIVVVR